MVKLTFEIFKQKVALNFYETLDETTLNYDTWVGNHA